MSAGATVLYEDRSIALDRDPERDHAGRRVRIDAGEEGALGVTQGAPCAVEIHRGIAAHLDDDDLETRIDACAGTHRLRDERVLARALTAAGGQEHAGEANRAEATEPGHWKTM